MMDTLFAMADVTGNGVLGLRELQYSSLLLAEFGVKESELRRARASHFG